MGELHRAPGLSIADVVLPFFTLFPAAFLILYGIGIVLTLGVVNAAGISPLVLAAFLIFIYLGNRPVAVALQRLPMIRGPTKGPDPYNPFGGGGEYVEKRKLCDMCGMEFGGERCNICGRTMCDTCWSNTSPYQRCIDCLRCPVCRSWTADHPCTICGKIVCSGCNDQGVCIECLSSQIEVSGSRSGAIPGSRVILEPLNKMSDALCRSINDLARRPMAGLTVGIGDVITILGTPQKVVAISPVKQGRVTVNDKTVVSIVNREERDGRLREIRRETGFPVCFADGCDYSIGRRCVSCSRFVCPNHSQLCSECGKIVCDDCMERELCRFCYDVKILGKPLPSITLMEIIRPLRIYVPALYLIIFLAVFYYGESLDSIHSMLRPTIFILILLSAPLYVLVSGLLSKRRG